MQLNHDDISILHNKDKKKVIIANKVTGAWIKLTKECYDLLVKAEKEKKSTEQLVDDLRDEEDRNYIKRLISYMEKYMFIKNSTNTYPVYSRDFNLSITHRCNLSCTHCFVSAESLKEPEYLSTEEIITLVDKILDCQPNYITITGGEPLARKDFFILAEYIKNKHKNKLSLLTNGTLITPQNAKMLSEIFDDIDISIDGVDEFTCSKTRGKGVFEKIISNVKLLQEAGQKDISLSMILNKYTYNKRNEFDKLNEELGTTPMERVLAPTGRACDNYDELFDGIVPEQAENDQGILVSSSSSGHFANHCSAITHKLHIDYDGGIYPCGGLALPEFKLGNLLKVENLNTFLEKKEYYKSEGYKNYLNAMPTTSPICKNCSVNVFCIQCPLYVHSYSKMGLFDEFCNVEKAAIEQLFWRDM